MSGLFVTAEGLAPDEERRRGAKRRLVEETRRLVEEVALLDAAAVPSNQIDALTARVGAAADDVAGHPSHREHGGLFSAPGFAARLLERSPISGESNPLAAPLRLWPDGEVTRGQAVYGAAYEGPPGILHGGVVAGAFDELLGMAQAASGSAGYTGTLTIRMRRPTPLGQPIVYEAGVDRIEGRKIHAWGRSSVDGQTLVEGEAVFIARYGL
jgi:acyl-coenzyme A thioesterase PaaI-like protein